MPHSPTNSRSSTSSIKINDALMETFDKWLSSFRPEQLRPFGQVPAEEAFSRRNSQDVHTIVHLQRSAIQFPISHRQVMVRSKIVQMAVAPPYEIGGLEFVIAVPTKWWDERRLGPDDICTVLRGEAEARVQGRPQQEIYPRQYRSEIRDELEELIRSLSTTALDYKPLENAYLQKGTKRLVFEHNAWTITYTVVKASDRSYGGSESGSPRSIGSGNTIASGTASGNNRVPCVNGASPTRAGAGSPREDTTIRAIELTFTRGDDEVEFILPIGNARYTPNGLQDWLLIEISV